jgi:hypothetical protein
MVFGMTSNEIATILDRVRSWPEERQEELARIALQLEEQDERQYDLSDAQLDSLRRIRREAGGGAVASDEEMADLWKQCGL